MFPFFDEDIPMTFQIGMVASDGVLIASDQKTGRWEKFATTSHAPKIYCDEALEQFPSWCIQNYHRRAECPASFRYTPSAEPV
jgi:hypothetical protein